jgi:hypothetical protein
MARSGELDKNELMAQTVHTCWYGVHLEKGIITLPFENGDAPKE